MWQGRPAIIGEPMTSILLGLLLLGILSHWFAEDIQAMAM
ncbi:hypothetical protein GGP84_002539 [Salinibacter ruber]|nr:hypothetical protein [Salinibacter ruber]